MTQTPATTPHLSWLFAAFFKEGAPVIQDQTDTPKEQPEGSAFTDVLARESDLTHFELHHEDGDKIVTVDLTTGAFIVNGVPLDLHNQNFEPSKYPLKLIYFRETRIEQTTRATVQEDGTIKEVPVGDARHYINRYFIGWETTVNGKNKQVTLAVG